MLISNLTHKLASLAARISECDGQAIVEYGLILAVISVGAVALLLATSNAINDVFQTLVSAL